jgi:RNA polymerase sigma-70 factor (ECF subfamily)
VGVTVVGVPMERVDAVARPSAEELWRAHYATLAGWVAGMAGDTEVGHEIAAEAFTRLLGRWRSVEDPRGFLYVVATNALRDHWRREGRRRRATSRLRLERQRDTAAADPGVRDLVDRLPERYRAIVLLHYYADLTVADCARALGRPEGTVKRELTEARAQMLASLQETP